MIHGYTSLNHPMSQIEAAEEFCESICAFVQDEWDDTYDGEGDPPDVEEIHALNVLDCLAKLGLRFEVGSGDGDKVGLDGYFSFKFRGRPIDRVLHGLARQVAEELQENLLPELSFELVVEIVTIHGCLLDNFIFVPDDDAVTSKAYMTLLNAPSSILFDEEKPS